MPVSLQMKFNTLLNQEKKPFAAALEAVLFEYKAQNSLSEAIQQAIDLCLQQLKEVEFGKIFPLLTIKKSLSSEIFNLFQYAALREQSIVEAPSPLVADCENKIALEPHSPKVIFEQALRLEKALLAKEVSNWHINEVQEKILELVQTLYQKFGEIILDSEDLQKLKERVSTEFNRDIVSHEGQVQQWLKEIKCQIEFLENKKFFDAYYRCATLAQKYDFVYDFYQALKKTPQMTLEIKATLSALFFAVLDKAFAPLEAEKFKLMRNRNATIEMVDADLNHWIKNNWCVFESTDLLTALLDKFDATIETYRDWEDVHFTLDEPGTDEIKGKTPMFQVHCFKYCGDPKEDPRELLNQQRSICAPLSPIKVASRSLSSQTDPNPGSKTPSSTTLSLRCDETLEDYFAELDKELDTHVLKKRKVSYKK